MNPAFGMNAPSAPPLPTPHREKLRDKMPAPGRRNMTPGFSINHDKAGENDSTRRE
jgi:hypothetical protein